MNGRLVLSRCAVHINAMSHVKGMIVRCRTLFIALLKVERVTKETMQQLDTGTLYVTNKRLIFTGNKKTSNIKLEKILSVIPYSNGIEIVKDAGRSPVFVVPSEADILAMTLSRAINDI